MEKILIKKNFLIIAPVFPPFNSSGANQLSDLADEFSHQGHLVTVVTPSPFIKEQYKIEKKNQLKIIRIKTPSFRDVGYIRRTCIEFIIPYIMIAKFYLIIRLKQQYDGIICYSPTIFMTPLVKFLKKKKIKTYLIVRDIFPQCALDINILAKGFTYFLLKFFESRQYKYADVIGIQSEGNLIYFNDLINQNKKIKVLHNWLKAPTTKTVTFSLKQTKISNRKVLVYAGNMGIAQDLNFILALVKRMQVYNNIGFLFVGRGSYSKYISDFCSNQKNAHFVSEIPADQIHSLYKQCSIGIVSLDRRHSTHNIPGKFLSYIASGLPVVAIVNPGNDLVNLINEESVGFATSETNEEIFVKNILKILKPQNQVILKARAKKIYKKYYSPRRAVDNICDEFI